MYRLVKTSRGVRGVRDVNPLRKWARHMRIGTHCPQSLCVVRPPRPIASASVVVLVSVDEFRSSDAHPAFGAMDAFEEGGREGDASRAMRVASSSSSSSSSEPNARAVREGSKESRDAWS